MWQLLLRDSLCTAQTHICVGDSEFSYHPRDSKPEDDCKIDFYFLVTSEARGEKNTAPWQGSVEKLGENTTGSTWTPEVVAERLSLLMVHMFYRQ